MEKIPKKEIKTLENLMIRREELEAILDIYYHCDNYYYLFTSTQDYVVFEMADKKEIKVKIKG